MKRGVCITAAALFLFSVELSFAALNMEEGLWEITSTVDMPGVPAKPFTHSTCLTKEKAVPQMTQSGCTVKDVKIQANTITWTVVCKEGMSTSTGKIIYAGATMDGAIETTVNSGGKTMTMKTTIKGRRLGPCK